MSTDSVLQCFSHRQWLEALNCDSIFTPSAIVLHMQDSAVKLGIINEKRLVAFSK